MDSNYDELRDHIESRGASRSDAQKAVNNCAKAMAKQAAASYFAGGVLMYFMNTNPASAFGYGTIAVGMGAGNALVNSDECARVRQALDFWSTTTD